MPTIKRISLTPLEYALAPEKAYGMSRGLNFRRSCSLVEIETSDGVVGLGEAFGPPLVAREYLRLLEPFFLGRSIFEFEIVAANVWNRLYHLGLQNQMTSCLSGISIGLADAIGRSFGVPVHDLLGGRSADRLPVYASTGYMTKDPENQLEAQLARVAAGGGFIGAKIKIGASPSSDVERVRIARGILGDDALLLVDMNGNYTPDLALESMRRIERFAIHWVEEPLPPTDVRGYAELRARAPIPIAAGEALYTVQDFKRLVDARGLDILQPSVPMCGGLQQAKAVALLAAMNNIRFSPHVWGGAVGLAAALHLVASVPPSPHTDNIPCPMLIEYDMGDNPLRDRLLKEPIRLEDGHLILPQGPGLGIEVDSEVVAEFRLS